MMMGTLLVKTNAAEAATTAETIDVMTATDTATEVGPGIARNGATTGVTIGGMIGETTGATIAGTGTAGARSQYTSRILSRYTADI